MRAVGRGAQNCRSCRIDVDHGGRSQVESVPDLGAVGTPNDLVRKGVPGMAGAGRWTPVWLLARANKLVPRASWARRVLSSSRLGPCPATIVCPYPPGLLRTTNMPPRPRRTTRSETSASVTTASVTASPDFSVRNSKESTPATSAIGETDKPSLTRRSSRKSVVESKKRNRESDEEADHEDTGKARAKRRAVNRKVYVEIQVPATVCPFLETLP